MEVFSGKTWSERALSDFLARKIYAISECVIVEIGIQTHSDCTNSINKLVHNLPCRRKFFVGVYFRGIWIFQKKFKFGFLPLFVRITFRGFHVQYLTVTKLEAIWLFSLHSVCKQFIEVQQWIFVGRSLFSRDLTIADQWKIFEDPT